MSCFADYSHYYDLLYRDKNYVAEADYVSSLLERYAPIARSLCEFGCGTGRMASMLAGKGYSLRGVDLSYDMLAEAERQKAKLPGEHSARISFSHGDIRSIRLSSTFDAVISLFHVMSYQQKNADLRAAFASAALHLNQGGLFLFDVWYGPAVMSQTPAVRVKRCEDDTVRLIRIAEPVIRYQENLVDVNYQMLIIDKQTGQLEEILETHTMRYLFLPEIYDLLDEAGFRLCDSQEWLTGNEPGLDSWGVCFVAQKM